MEWGHWGEKDVTEVEANEFYGTLAYVDEAHKVYEWTLSNFLKIFSLLDGAFPSDDATNVTKIVKDKSDDTHAYEDNAHEVILRTFSYFLKIATATHIDQKLSIFS